MDLSYSDEERLIADSVAAFVAGYDRRASIGHEQGYSPATLSQMAELGWIGAIVPEAIGGFGGSIVDGLIIHEGIGQGLIVEPVLVSVWAANLMGLADPERAAALVPALISGEQVATVAMHDHPVRAIGDVFASSARRAGDDYVFSGRKVMVPWAPVCDWILIPVTCDDELTLFVAQSGALADRMQSCRTIDGQQAADIDLEGLSLPAAARVSGQGGLARAIEDAQGIAIMLACAEALGAMEQAVRITADHLNTRQQFGVALATFQVLQHRIADMAIACEEARSALLLAASKIGDESFVHRQAGVSAAKALISRKAAFVAAQAVQLHGGIGVTEEHVISHYFRKLDAFSRRWGDAEFHYGSLAAHVRDGATLMPG